MGEGAENAESQLCSMGKEGREEIFPCGIHRAGTSRSPLRQSRMPPRDLGEQVPCVAHMYTTLLCNEHSSSDEVWNALSIN